MSDLFEIVELPDGQVVLKRIDDESAPLVSISFSQEALYFLNQSKFSVAKAMIEAGLDAAGDQDEDEQALAESQDGPQILH
ncbi:hypothetical protein [Agaribacterium haliotis]|uniref:hypothetical protein n=1 Tax=Agaribacterium haliotis TaxID=2013869 RepID=UPI000BB5532A|nr:hypothetical protein [Agaribacterium haliotis]